MKKKITKPGEAKQIAIPLSQAKEKGYIPEPPKNQVKIVTTFGIKSSQINQLEYTEENKELIIRFHRGGSYKYSPVQKEMFLAFGKSISAGSFFAKYIKNNKAIKCIKI